MSEPTSKPKVTIRMTSVTGPRPVIKSSPKITPKSDLEVDSAQAVTPEIVRRDATGITVLDRPASPSIISKALQNISDYSSRIVFPVLSTEDIKKQWISIQEVKKFVITDEDRLPIKNVSFIKKSGWRKIAVVFGLQDEILKLTREDYFTDEDGVTVPQFTWYVAVRVTHLSSGRYVDAVGSCSSEERGFAHLRHDVLAQAHTRAKNRGISDIIGSGETSYEEISE